MPGATASAVGVVLLALGGVLRDLSGGKRYSPADLVPPAVVCPAQECQCSCAPCPAPAPQAVPDCNCSSEGVATQNATESTSVVDGSSWVVGSAGLVIGASLSALTARFRTTADTEASSFDQWASRYGDAQSPTGRQERGGLRFTRRGSAADRRAATPLRHLSVDVAAFERLYE